MESKGEISQNMKIVGIAVIIALLAGGGIWFSMSGSEEEKSLKIGALNTMTGKLKFVGKPFLRSEKMAVQDINEAGGVLGSDVELVSEDTGTKAAGANDAAKKLIDVEGVDVMVGAVSTGGTMAIVNVVSSSKVPTISPSATATKLSNAKDDDFLFRTCPADKIQGAGIAKVAKKRGYTKVNILSRNDAYGIGLEEIFSKKFKELGGKIGKKVRYNPDAGTFDSYIQNAKSGNPDAILLNGLMEDGARMLRTAANMGVTKNIDFLCSEGVQNPDIPKEVGKNNKGEYIVSTANTGGATPYPEKGGFFADQYQEKYGEKPVAYCANAYDATALLALATEKAGTDKRKEIRNALRDVANSPGEEVSDIGKALELLRDGEKINYQGASGKITFDQNGDTLVGRAKEWFYAENGEIVRGEEIQLSLD